MIYSRRMPSRARLPRARAAAAVAAAAVLVLAPGCGGNDRSLIPASSARDLLAHMDEIETRVDNRACTSVRNSSLPALRREVDGLPKRVDPAVRTTLDDGLGRLEELVRTECRPRLRTTTREPTVTPTPEPQTTTPTQPQDTTPNTQPETPSTPDQGTGGGDSGGGGGDDGSGNDGGGGGA